MYILALNGVVEKYPYSINQLKKDNPQTSFPASPTNELLESFNVFSVVPTERPIYDPITHDLREVEPVLIDKVWTQSWEVVAADPAEVEQRVNSLAIAIRYDRDQKLYESDWIVAKSYEQQKPIPTEWITYRQALRDITSQPEFPTTVIWPDKPDK